MISELNENKLFQTKVHLEVILKEGFKIIEENEFSFNIYFSLFKRYIYSFESLNLLLLDYDQNKRYREHPISIVLRAGLLDYLITLYLATYQAQKKSDPRFKPIYEKEIDKLVSEQIRRYLNVSEKDKQFVHYNQDDYRKDVDMFKKMFSRLFNPDIPIDYNKPGKSLRYQQKEDITTTTIRKRLDEVKNGLENIHYQDVFYLYNLYSKYDHFGTTSMLLEYSDIEIVITNILGSIFHICEGIGFCIELMIDEVSCKSDFKELENRLAQLRGTVYTKTLYLSPEYKERHQ